MVYLVLVLSVLCPRPRMGTQNRLLLWALPWAAVACSAPQMPDPTEAAARYAAAVRSGDAAALHELLTSRARSHLSRDDVVRIVEQDRAELEQRAQAVSDPRAELSGEARLELDNGLHAQLAFEEGAFFVDDPFLGPSFPRTPERAVELLAGYAERRDLAALLALLTLDERTRLLERFETLASLLQEREGAQTLVRGERASVHFPNGLTLHFRKEGGAWRLEGLP